MAKRKSKKRAKGYLLPKYQDKGRVEKYATEPIKETSFGDWWEDFEKSDVGKFVDAKGLRKEKNFFLGLLGYGDTAEEGRRFALDAASMVNPIPDFINAADHYDQGKYTDAALYAGFGLLPGAAGPVVNKVKSYLNPRNKNLSKTLATSLDEATLNPDLIEEVLPKVQQIKEKSLASSDNLILDSKKIKTAQDDIAFTQKTKELQSKVPLTRVLDKNNLVVKDGKLFNNVEPYTVMTESGLSNTTVNRNTSHWSYGHIGDPGHGSWKGKSTAIISDYESLSKKGYALDFDPTDTFFYNSKNMEVPEGSLILTRDKKLYEDIIKNTNQKNVKYYPNTTNDEFESIVNSYSKKEGDESGKDLFERYLEKNWKEGKDVALYKPASNYKPVLKNVYDEKTGMYYQVEDPVLKTIGSPFGGGSSKIHGNTPLHTIERSGNSRLSKDVFDLYPDSFEFENLLKYPKEIQLAELEKYKSLKRRKPGSKSIAELENAMAKNSGFNSYADFKKNVGLPQLQQGGLVKAQNGYQLPKYQTEGKVYSGGMLPEVTIQPDQIKYNWNDPILDNSSFYNQQKRNAEVQNFARQLFDEQRGSIEDRMQKYRDDPTNPLAYTPDADFSSIGYHLNEGNYGDAALYSLFAALPGAAGPIVNRVKPYLNKLKSFFKSSKIPKNFKSEIDWGKWNKEIPDNKELIEEYNTIEALSKKEGTWMKNPDGSEFTGTPEQFVQQRSKNFRAAFGEIDPYYAYRGTQHHFPEIKQKVFTSLDKSQAEKYAHYIDNPKTIASPEHGNFGGIHELYVKNSDNAADFTNLLGQDWGHLDLNRDLNKYIDLNIKGNKKRIPILEKEIINETDPHRKKLLEETLQNTKDNLKRFENYTPNTVNISSGKKAVTDKLNQAFKGTNPATDDILEKIIELDIDNALLRDIYDESFGSVLMVNNRPGNFVKSTYGNDGMFDMTNPNIYKEDGGEVTDPQPLAYPNGPISKEEAQQEFERRKKAEDIYNLIIPSAYSTLDNYFNALRIGKDTDVSPRTTFVDPRSEEAFKQYLDINLNPKYFSLSPNKPSIAKNPDAVYYKLDPKLERQILKFAKTQDIPLNKMVEFSEADLPWDWENMDESGYNEYSALGTFQIGKGIDPETKEEYYSYYDKYDFPEHIQSGVEGITEGLGRTPFEIYNRLPVNPKRTFAEEEYQRALEEDIRQQELELKDLDEFQEGGEVTDPEDPFANALQSRQPYRDDYMNKLLKYAEPGDDTYMRIEDAFADKFNTELTPIEKIHYKLWLEAGFGNPRDIGVYDIQGYWKSGQWKNNSDPDNHGSDTFKKPNHPTFSAESKYSKQKGGSEYIGGVWREDGGFMAGPHNFYDNDALMWEFNREPNRPEYLYMGLPAVTVNGSDK